MLILSMAMNENIIQENDYKMLDLISKTNIHLCKKVIGTLHNPNGTTNNS